MYLFDEWVKEDVKLLYTIVDLTLANWLVRQQFTLWQTYMYQKANGIPMEMYTLTDHFVFPEYKQGRYYNKTQ